MRTALFTWLFARNMGGIFILRIEDTDQSRKVEGVIEQFLDALRWLGMDWDEGPEVGGDHGPYIQSQRLAGYHQAADELLEAGEAYRCYCTIERLAEMRQEQNRLNRQTGYDRRCRHLSSQERRGREAERGEWVVRFAMPLEGTTRVTDLIRGEVSFENRLIDDFVILKSDGFPTYHLAVVVDDHKMEISHVLRAEEWLPSTPRHLLICRALGWEPPKFAHLPMILAPDRSKLSKRHGATSVLEYRQMGYLPNAMVNFLALMGWSLDDKTDLFSTGDLVRHFSIERVGRSGAVFNLDKLNWLNGHYTRQLTPEELTDRLLDYWRRYLPEEVPALPDGAYLLRIVPLIHERLKTLKDAAPLVAFFFKQEAQYESQELVQKGMDAEGTRLALSGALESLSGVKAFDADAIEAVLRPLAEDLGVKVGQLFGSLRIATTGLRVSPPLFETLEVLGKERSLAAVRDALARL